MGYSFRKVSLMYICNSAAFRLPYGYKQLYFLNQERPLPVHYKGEPDLWL